MPFKEFLLEREWHNLQISHNNELNEHSSLFTIVFAYLNVVGNYNIYLLRLSKIISPSPNYIIDDVCFIRPLLYSLPPQERLIKWLSRILIFCLFVG